LGEYPKKKKRKQKEALSRGSNRNFVSFPSFKKKKETARSLGSACAEGGGRPGDRSSGKGDRLCDKKKRGNRALKAIFRSGGNEPTPFPVKEETRAASRHYPRKPIDAALGERRLLLLFPKGGKETGVLAAQKGPRPMTRGKEAIGKGGTLNEG